MAGMSHKTRIETSLSWEELVSGWDDEYSSKT